MNRTTLILIVVLATVVLAVSLTVAPAPAPAAGENSNEQSVAQTDAKAAEESAKKGAENGAEKGAEKSAEKGAEKDAESSAEEEPGKQTKKCKYDIQQCLNMMVEKLKGRGWVGIEYMYDEETHDSVIVRVVKDGPAETAGMKVGDRMIGWFGVLFDEATDEQTSKFYEAMVPGATVTYTVVRGDADTLDVPVELGEAPQNVLAQWIGMHMLQYHVEPQPESGD